MDQSDIIRQKIYNQENISEILAYWKFKSKKIVFTNGCFDIIHRGHIEYLAKAASMGDVLMIGLNTDASVRRLKGEGRPVQDQYSRALILASFFFIDAVVFFDDDTPANLIETVQPDVLVKGGDYEPDKIVGADTVQKKGGLVTTIPFVDGFSTTSILKSVIK